MTSGYFNKAYTINILIHNTYLILRKKKKNNYHLLMILMSRLSY